MNYQYSVIIHGGCETNGMEQILCLPLALLLAAQKSGKFELKNIPGVQEEWLELKS